MYLHEAVSGVMPTFGILKSLCLMGIILKLFHYFLLQKEMMSFFSLKQEVEKEQDLSL